MVERQIRERGIERPAILRAFGDVPRHEFVPDSLRDRAYGDEPLPLIDGEDAGPESISQPYLSALMIELLELEPGDRVLEIGTGSGYDAALLSRLAATVYTIEIDPRLAEQAEQRLARLGYDNVRVRVSDGHEGWAEEAPFDAILLTAAPREVPTKLIGQLEIGGRMVVPVGTFVQELLVITRTASGEEKRTVMPIRVSAMRDERR
ncbi:MAG: protein-L-isoaspartate(D-aspartate) O-methyltransferase [Acidobacteria bacterium]|nr:MAG: protein-L-isoaspartate(D-aspartate) O-methyltransferase [Acidobacteriota bacterium]REK11356.1 MAG: protein-L-isoaspartate(D-aspartate) O-methyltransferase [Acidobacteriota bacterium]